MIKFDVLRRRWGRNLALVFASILLSVPSVFAQTNVTTQHNDAARSGANLSETVLTTANVNVAQFGKLFERTVDDEVYAQPLYVSNVSVPTVGVRNVLYVATVSNSVYAFDADNPTATAPLWRVTYINPPSIVPVNRTDVGQACGAYLDFAGNIGIVGTPVIDTATHTMYFVARTKESGVFVQRLHAIDIRDGSERPNSPVNIQATVPGTGDGSDAQHNVPFNSRTQNQRAALLLLNGAVYIAWGSHCDQGPYHGWILGYNAASLQQTTVFNTTPNGGLGGIWHSGRGLSADSNGNIYALVGNGTFDADVGGTSYSNAFLKINAAGTVLDWFTPHNWQFLNTTDADLFHGALLVPDTNLAVGGGKQGVLYVLNRDNMGRFRAGADSQIVQSFQASTSGRMNGSPIYWNTPNNGPMIYLWPGGDPLKAFRLVNGMFQTTPVGQSSQLAPSSMPGGILSLSADGSQPGTGIVWAALSAGGDANNETQPGMLRAYDASDVTRQLWNSQQNAGRDGLGNFSKFTAPTIVNGRVYLATFSNKVVAYGLLAVTGNAPPVVNAGVDQSIVLPSTASLTGTVTDDGNPNPPGVVTRSWTKVSGPGTVTFSAPTALTTTATFSTAGTYTVRLTASDSVATSFDDVVVTVNSSGTGTGLQAQYFNDPGTGTYFTTLALERADAVIDFAWATGGPAAGVQTDNFSVRWIGLVQAPITGDYRFSTLSNDGVRLWVNDQLLIDNWTDHDELTDTSAALPLTAGTTYTIRIEFYDHLGPATARLMWEYPGQARQAIPQLQLYPPLPTNQPPTANAGLDQVITLPAVAALRGSASDDGLPNPPGIVTAAWSMVSGREGSIVTFTNPNSLSTDASFPLPGVYVLRLTVGDSGLTVSDDITITVNPAPSGAGQGLTGQYFNDPGSGTRFVSLVLTRTDPTVAFDWGELAPAPGLQIENFSVRWTGRVQAVVTGPHVFTTTADDGVRLWLNNQLIIDNWVNQAATTRSSLPVSLTANVLYDIRLEFYDHEEDAIVRLEWSYPGQAQSVIPQSQLYPATGLPNQPPMVGAGVDRTVTLPNTLALTGTSADDGLPIPPGVVSVTWSQVSGPGAVTFSAASSLTTTVTFPAAGAYTLRLTGTDGAFTATDDVVVTVNPAPGTGLTAQYYNDPGSGSRFTTLVLTRTDATVNFTWGTASPAAGVQADNFSVIWTGQVFAPVTGNYTFSTISTDGVRLWVNGQLVINNWTDHASTTNTGAPVALTSGSRYDIRLEYYDATGDATARLRWAYTGQATQAIPQSRLYPATIPANQTPIVNAGVDRSITLPATASLTGTATDDGLPNPPATVTTAWTKVSGPGTVTFGTPTALTTTATFSVAGSYVLRLTASDGTLSASDDVSVTVNPPTNQAPTVNAGVDQTITLPSTASLAGTATDDGLPNPPVTVTTAWTMVSGPGPVTFGTPAALTTTATFSVAGSYVLRLTASDGTLSASDDVSVTVNPLANQAPTVNAGVDRTITLPATASLVGMATDDGFPSPPATMTTTWTMVSGPGTVTFGTPTALTTTATFSVVGSYVLRLTASDGTLSASDDVNVTVGAANQAPTVHAGSDQTITLPGAAGLTGTATDDGLPSPPATVTTIWTTVSGPGPVTFGTPAALTTTATFSVAGAYVLRLAASDGTLSASDDVNVTVGAANQAPTVNAGSDQTITLPGTAGLTGTATDDGLPSPPATVTTAWTMVSGPGTVTFSAPAALTTTATFSVAGSYVLRLTASDGTLSSSDDVSVTVDAAANQGPTVNAGGDQTITLPSAANLVGTSTDDGLPNPPASVTTAWTMVSGPGTVTFGTPAALTTTATFSVAGAYVLRLTASDGTLSTSDDVSVTVGAANLAPTVNAGVDQTITLPSVASLVGTATDDGQPNPPAILNTMWSRVSGPGTVTFSTPAALTTTATFSVAGAYILRLTASDGTLTTTDDVSVTVNPPANQAPTVNAGVDRTITLPATASLVGMATDDGLPNPPATVTTVWTMVSGPGTVTFSAPAALTTTATFSVAGAYVLRLTASDGALNRTDDVAVTVNAALGSGTGLTGEYYNDNNSGARFRTLVLTRLDPTINFNWGSGSPASVVHNQNFSARWTGQIEAVTTGSYTFSVVSDDGVRLWVNGQLILDYWIDQGLTTRTSAPVSLVAGTKYAIRLEYFERTGGAVVRLQWAYPGQATQIVPQSRLYP